MSPTQEQLIALGAVFEAAYLVDKIAKTGQASEAPLICMLGSLLVREPQNTVTRRKRPPPFIRRSPCRRRP